MNAPPLEPQAIELRPDDDGRIRLSVAISLKRIADALDQPEIVTINDVRSWMGLKPEDKQ